jgi:DNA-binding NarL/FixJ family response regulator
VLAESIGWPAFFHRQHRLVALPAPGHAVVAARADGADGAALVSLPQAGRTHDLAVHSFARQHGFSRTETEVLQALLGGQRPSDIARAKGVQLSTVRTQIGQLRLKCGAHSIRELLDRVAALPPMMALVQ